MDTHLLLADSAADIIDAAASGNAIKFLSIVAVSFGAAIVALAGALAWLWNKRETVRDESITALKAADVRRETEVAATETRIRGECKTERDTMLGEIAGLRGRIDVLRDAARAEVTDLRNKHEGDITRLYGDMLKLAQRVQRAAEKLANIQTDEET